MDSTWLDIFIGGVVAILAIALMGGLLYVSIFRAKEWNYPNMARGFGIGFLGLIIVGISELAKSEGAGDWASYIQTSGVVIGVVGFLWFIFGMGQD